MAATIEVTSAADDGAGDQCTLREAITSMNTAILAGECEYYNGIGTFGLNNRILFDPALAGETIQLVGSDMSVQALVQIDGSTAPGIVIDANGLNHVFRINGIVSMNDLTLTGAMGNFGGAVSVYDSQLYLDNMTITGNSANRGGGIYLTPYSSLTLSNSTVSGNHSRDNGGGILINGTNAEISNSTISGNNAGDDGGGVHIRFGSTVSITNSTFTENSGRVGGGIYAGNSNVELINSIVAGSTGGGDCAFSVDSDSATIIEDGSCSRDARSVDPRLGPLANNGGVTLTHAIKPNSPARNTGDFASCEVLDQRGQLRDDGDESCDVGAIEFNEDDDFGDDGSLIVIPLENNRAVIVPN